MTRKFIKKIGTFVLALSLLVNMVLPVAATETLRASDIQFDMPVYSTKAEGKYLGTFLKKNNVLYIDIETIENMAELRMQVDNTGNILRIERADEDGEGAVHVVTDEETVTFEGVVFYPFIEVVTDLCINALYNSEEQYMYVIPGKNIWALVDMLEEMQNNSVFCMAYWRNTDIFNAETSRYTAQLTDIGRNLFTLPSTSYKYLSGDADYESYRNALWEVMLAPVDCGVTATDSFVQELEIYKYLDIWKEVPEDSKVWGKISGPGKLVGKAAAAINDAGTVLQLEDNMTAIKFYYNIDNMNESVSRGVELLGRTGLVGNTNFNQAVEDTIDFNSGDTSLSDIFLKNMDQGVIEYALNQLEYGFNATVGQFYVAVLDVIAGEISQNGYTKEQVDGIIKATSSLEVQDAAKRSYNYYHSLYSNTNNLSKQISALQNMKDTTLVYMLAGHNAWKAFEFDQDMKEASAVGTQEMAEYISYLLGFGEEDFNVYQNALNTKYAIMAEQGNREQFIYFLEWDAERAEEIGGVELTLEGRSTDNLGLLHKYMFNHQYFQQNGMLVGNIYKTASQKDSARVEYYTIEGVTELVIRPANEKTSITYADVRVAEGIMLEDRIVDLSPYLVTEQDGTQVYRIPLPLGSGTSDGTALPTQTISAMEEIVGVSKNNETENETYTEDGRVYQMTDYVATPPFDSVYVFDYNDGYYTFRYNSQMLYIAALSNPWAPHIGLAAHKDNMFTEEVCQMYLTDESIEQYHEDTKSDFDRKAYENVSLSDIKYLKAGDTTIGYFEGEYYWKTTKNNYSITYFQVDFGEGVGLRGMWNNLANEAEALTIEEFLIEAFSNVAFTKRVLLEYDGKVIKLFYDCEEIVLEGEDDPNTKTEINVQDYKGEDYRLIIDTENYSSIQNFYDVNVEDCKKRFTNVTVTELERFTCGGTDFYVFFNTYTDNRGQDVFLPIYFTELEAGVYCYIYIGDTIQYGTDCQENPQMREMLQDLFVDVVY